MNSDKIKTIVGIVGALFGIYNLAASHFGWGIVQFDSAAVTTAVSTLWTLGFTAYSTWKNCNLSSLAKELQAFKDAVKNKDVSALENALATLSAIKNEVASEISE